MKRGAAIVTSVAALIAAPHGVAADEGRFDAQVFRPLAAPRDLVMVPKSEVIGHLSPVVGVYWDAALDPLALALGDTGRTLHAVGARLQITPILGIGLVDWVELSMAVPFVAWQTSDNLRSIGTEGEVKSTPTLGDVRISTKVAMPFLNRKDEVKSGFGLALGGNINVPTGDELAFTSDGAISGGVSVIADYRFNFGLILASNLGVWFRPEHQFAGVKIGDMAQFGVAAEMYVVQRWGLSVVGELYGYPSLTKYPDSAAQVPAEVLLGVRWQTRQGITITMGGSFGAACGFGAPALRVFNSVTWQPKSSVEQREINRLLERDALDPDHDGLIDTEDRCPDKPGRPENFGCPDADTDQDGLMDREDECPGLAQGPGGKRGCPLARLKKDKIAIAEPINFEADTTIITDASKLVLESVARVLHERPDILLVEIQGHTDVRESDIRSLLLSGRRMKSVMQYLIDHGVSSSRLEAKGYGARHPIENDKGCLGPDEDLTPRCREATSKNRRVVFLIKSLGTPRPTPIVGGDPDKASLLPSGAHVLPMGAAVLSACKKEDSSSTGCSVLTKEGVLKKDTVLGKPNTILPSEPSLPSGGNILPKGGSNLPRK
jgi:outer membrane protein OmpA-like peptidoglycan-associated protein